MIDINPIHRWWGFLGAHSASSMTSQQPPLNSVYGSIPIGTGRNYLRNMAMIHSRLLLPAAKWLMANEACKTGKTNDEPNNAVVLAYYGLAKI